MIPRGFREVLGIPIEFLWDSEKSDSLLIIVEMLFVEYQSLVLEAYESKKIAGDLSHRMLHLSPGRLKEECKAVCNKRYDRKDDKALEDFFGQGGEKEAWLKAIDKCEVDKFRPLVKFLRGSTSMPDPKNVELLSWLIDFRPRPIELARAINSPNIPDIKRPVAVDGPPGDKAVEITGSVKSMAPPNDWKDIVEPTPEFNSRKLIVPVIILVALIIGIYLVWFKIPTVVITGRQGCMYWTGDHYQQVDCHQKIERVQVIALDSEKLVQFKKITRPDTITENSINKIWYTKYNGSYEYYTDSGFHPIDQQIRLRPLSKFIIAKHIPVKQ